FRGRCRPLLRSLTITHTVRRETAALQDFDPVFVRFGSKADKASSGSPVCFTPESGQMADISRCLLCAKSGLTHRSRKSLLNRLVGAGERRRRHVERDSRNGIYGISCGYSGLMLAPRITFAHFSVSSATNFPNSAGVIGMGSPASSARRACNFGSANTAFTAWFSFSTIVGGVPLGAAIPYQMLTS